MSYDISAIRRDFPILDQQVHGHPLIYFDNAATSQKPRQVIDAIVSYYQQDNANVHRGIHTLSERATAAYEGARTTVAEFLHASADEIVFVRNATEGINLLAWAWSREHLVPGDEILLTEMEHHANTIPWQQVARERGATIRYLPVDATTGELDSSAFDGLVTDRTKLFALTHMSNVLGTVPPVADLVRRAKERGLFVVIDGAQAAPHIAVDVRTLGCDAYVFTGHKLYGPTGIGVLYVRRDVLAKLPPYQTGGGMIESVERDHATWQDPPIRFEAGTPNIAGAVGLAAAIRYLQSVGLDAIHRHEAQLTVHALDRLRTVSGVHVYGPIDPSRRGALVAFTVDGIHPHDLGSLLDQEGIAIRAGHHCTQILHRDVLGQIATARISLGLYNTTDEIDRFILALQGIQQRFRR